MNNLKALKECLQIVMNSSTEGLDFKEALADAQYACSLGEPALNVIIFNWTCVELFETNLSTEDLAYQRGVKFVQNVWNEIMSKDKGEEG